MIIHRMLESMRLSRQRSSYDRRSAFMKSSGRSVIALFCGVVALGGLAYSPFSYGGEITYIWKSDFDSQPVNASLIVNDSTQQQGVITRGDVDSFFLGTQVEWEYSTLPIHYPRPFLSRSPRLTPSRHLHHLQHVLSRLREQSAASLQVWK